MGNRKLSRPAAGKFTEFRLDERDPQRSPVLAAILKDMEGQPSILHLLRSYQGKLEKDALPGNPWLAKLAWLFKHGQASTSMVTITASPLCSSRVITPSAAY